MCKLGNKFSLAVLIGRGLDHKPSWFKIAQHPPFLPLSALFSFQGIYPFSYRLRNRAAYFLLIRGFIRCRLSRIYAILGETAVAQVTIEYSTRLVAERGKLAACVSEVLESALGLHASPAFFGYREKADEKPAVCVTVLIFPAGSARQRRMVCAEMTRRLSSDLGISAEQVVVTIDSPPQERGSCR